MTKGLQNRLLVVRSLVTEENVQRAIIDRFGALQQLVGVVLTDFADDKGRHNLVHWIEA